MKNRKSLFTALLICTLFSQAFASLSTVENSRLFHLLDELGSAKPSFEEVSIYRLQVEVLTNNFDGAQSDSPVFVKLNDNDDPFFINMSHNDRERNQVFAYDIISPNVNKIKDLDFIHLEIKGNDGWNVREVKLYVNHKQIFKKSFGSKGYWLDGNHKNRSKRLVISKSALKKSPNFGYNSQTEGIEKAPTRIPKNMLDALVESAVGNALSDVDDISWGKKQGKYFISSERINDNTLRYDLDLSYEITAAPNVEIDVDFDLVFSCENGVLQTKVENYKSKEYGVTAFLMKHLDKALYKKCLTLSEPTAVAACAGGVWLVGKMLDFDFDYDDQSVGNVGLTNKCTGDLKLDSQGNLKLRKTVSRPVKRPPSAYRSGKKAVRPGSVKPRPAKGSKIKSRPSNSRGVDHRKGGK